jgi:hypothetical protein
VSTPEGVRLKGGSGTWPSMRRCGGCGGASPFSAKAGEHGGQTRARASVCYEESICIPEWAGDPVEGAVDDGVELGQLR